MRETMEQQAIDEKEFSYFSDFSVFNKELKKNLSDLFKFQKKENYIPAMIAVSYSLMGATLRNNMFKFGGKEYDTRLSYIISLRSGNGKEIFVSIIEDFSEHLQLKCKKIVSIHEEGLIGKKLPEYDKSKNIVGTKEVEGCFKSDIIYRDDGLSFLREKNYSASRDYFIGAWDEYSRNKIEKKQVDIEDTLSYYPNFVSFIFIQDKSVPAINIDTGIIRKSLIIYVEAPEKDFDDFAKRAGEESPNYDYLIKIAKKTKNAKFNWTFTKDTDEFIAKKTFSITEKLKLQSNNGKYYSSILGYTIQNYLYKYSAILSAYYYLSKSSSNNSKYEIIVTSEIAKVVSDDFEKVVIASFNYWNKFVKREEASFNGAELVLINELKNRKATSKESAVIGNTEFLNELGNKIGKCETTMYSALGELEKRRIIKTDTIGKAEKGKENSMMWLDFINDSIN